MTTLTIEVIPAPLLDYSFNKGHAIRSHRRALRGGGTPYSVLSRAPGDGMAEIPQILGVLVKNKM